MHCVLVRGLLFGGGGKSTLDLESIQDSKLTWNPKNGVVPKKDDRKGGSSYNTLFYLHVDQPKYAVDRETHVTPNMEHKIHGSTITF